MGPPGFLWASGQAPSQESVGLWGLVCVPELSELCRAGISDLCSISLGWFGLTAVIAAITIIAISIITTKPTRTGSVLAQPSSAPASPLALPCSPRCSLRVSEAIPAISGCSRPVFLSWELLGDGSPAVGSECPSQQQLPGMAWEGWDAPVRPFPAWAPR